MTAPAAPGPPTGTPTATPTAAPTAAQLTRAQTRTLRVLVLAQALGAVGITIGIATASLLARDLSGRDSLAGLAQTCQVLGAAVASWYLAGLMSRRGRRVGLVGGWLLGASGGAVVVVAGAVGSMLLLLAGAVLLGSATAANSGARYAATDLAVADRRARSLAVVVWATTIGAVAGPNLTGPAAGLATTVGLPPLTGPFLVATAGMLVAALVIGLLLRPDPLLLAREAAGPPTGPPTGTSWSRVRAAVADRPALGWAVAGLAGAHAAMVAVMVMTPLHMEHGGSDLRVIGLVISIHVLGMFAFAPVVGWLADRFGRSRVLGAGGAVLLLALALCGAAPEGGSYRITAGLFLLGLGWSLATVSASTLVADLAPLEVRTDVQGASDLLMNVAAAAAGGLAGVVVGVAGYPALALGAVLLAGLVILAAVRTAAHPDRDHDGLAQLPG